MCIIRISDDKSPTINSGASATIPGHSLETHGSIVGVILILESISKLSCTKYT